MCQRYIALLPLACSLLGTRLATQARALTGNPAGNLSVHRPALNPVSHTIQGSKGNVLLMWKRWNKKLAEALKGINIDKFKNCFEQWKKYLNRCVASDGEHFEGD